MKKPIYLFASLALVAAACNDSKNNEPPAPTKPPVEEPEKPEPYPPPEPGLPFTEYSLTGKSIWLPLEDDTQPAEVIQINSDEELQRYVVRYIFDAVYPIPHVPSTDYPPIDFSKKTLLLARFMPRRSIENMVTNFQQLSTDKYRLKANLFISVYYGVPSFIDIAILVDKLSNDSRVDFEPIYFVPSEKGWVAQENI